MKLRKFMLTSTLLVVAALWFSCTNDEPIAPENQKSTTARGDDRLPQLPEGATAWLCTTSADFHTAVEEHDPGDWIFLTNDDTVFVYSGDDWYLDASLVGTDAGPSKFGKPLQYGYGFFGFTYDGALVKNVEIQGSTDYVAEGNNQVYEGVGSSFENVQFYGGLSWTADNLHVRDSRDPILIYNKGYGTYAKGNSWLDANSPCDFFIIGNPPLVVLTWDYNGSTYSFEDMVTPSVTEEEGVRYCGLPPDKDIFVRFNVPGSHAYGNEDIIDVDVEWGPSASYGNTVNACYSSSESEWQAKWDVSSYSNAYVYWRGKAMLCDSTYYTAGQRTRILMVGPCTTPAWYDCD